MELLSKLFIYETLRISILRDEANIFHDFIKVLLKINRMFISEISNKRKTTDLPNRLCV